MADELDRIDAEQVAERQDWVAQDASPLGRRRHVKAVRARLARGAEGAAVVGRRHLLSSAALAEELAATSTRPAVECPTVASSLRAELGLRVVGGRP